MKKDNIKEFIETVITREFKKIISESVSDEVYIIKNKKGEPIEQFKDQSEADKALEVYKKEHPDQELIVEPGEKLTFDQLDKMSEKLETMEKSHKKNEPKEGNAFSGALNNAKKHNKDTFSVDGKEYDVKEDDMDDPQFGDIEKYLDSSDDEEMSEEKHSCEKCGSEICECGSMNESKRRIRLKESDMIRLIQNIVNESFPAAEMLTKTRKGSGEQNNSALSDVEKKIKTYLKFDGNDNPKFPKQVGGEVKARRSMDKEVDEIAANRGGGMEDLSYDVEPSKETTDRHEMALKGDVKMGNSQDAANVIPTKLAEKIIQKVKRKKEEMSKAPMYAKDPQPIKNVNEAKNSVILEEIKRIKDMASYNKSTQ
jgi:hypothetical protein